MGYFDAVRPPASSTTVAAPTNVVQLRDDLHPYACAIRQAWLTRLDNLSRPWVQGAAWDTNCFVTARKLIELANSPWSGYRIGDARADYMQHAPFDHAWDKREKCWEQAQARAQSVALPEPPPHAPIPDVTTLTIDSEDDRDTVAKMFPLLDWHELWDADDDEEWIVEPLLPARRAVALYSAPKVGKSLLMLEIAVGIARATEVLGVTPDRPRKVLYVDFENDPRGDVRSRLQSMEVGPDDLDNLCYLSFPSLAKLDTEMGGIQLVAAAQFYGCEVVIIDTVSRAVSGEENANDTWLAFYRNTGLALKSLGIACIRLDHTGKDKAKGMRGGSAKYGDVDAVWKLESTSENTVILECTDHRMPIPQPFLALERQAFPLRHVVAGTHWSDALDSQALAVDRELDDLGVPCSASVRDCGAALREAGKGVRQEVLTRAVKARKLRLDLPDERKI